MSIKYKNNCSTCRCDFETLHREDMRCSMCVCWGNVRTRFRKLQKLILDYSGGSDYEIYDEMTYLLNHR